MNAKTRILFCLTPILVLLCSGCIFVRQTDSPGASGMVVDSMSHSPIEGVEVAMSNAKSSLGLTNALVRLRGPIHLTDTAGKFSVPADTSLAIEPIYLLPAWLTTLGTTNSARWAAGTLVLRRDGYEPKLVPIFAKGSCNAGLIKLVAKQPRPRANKALHATAAAPGS